MFNCICTFCWKIMQTHFLQIRVFEKWNSCFIKKNNGYVLVSFSWDFTWSVDAEPLISF